MDTDLDLGADNFHEIISQSLMKYIQAEWESPIKDFYVSLNPASIATMEITLGPHCSKEDINQVKTLREKYGIVCELNKSGVRIRNK
jgi:hypothetical protein